MTSSRARPGPARSAIRCGPPPAGVRPTTFSTRPNLADSEAKIRSQPSATSSPHVRHSACTEASVGSGMSSSRCTTRTRPWKIWSAWSGVLPWKWWTSTPPVNERPSARKTSARTCCASASSSAASRSLCSSGVQRLSGGESTTTTPTSPSRSKRTSWSATQLGRDPRQLVRARLLGAGGELERIVHVARDRVDVEVEDRLPRGGPARVEQVHAVAAELLLLHAREALSAGGGGGEVCFRDLEVICRVVARDHQRMAPRPRIDVHEGG